MSETVLVALITGAASVLGVMLTNLVNNIKVIHELEKQDTSFAHIVKALEEKVYRLDENQKTLFKKIEEIKEICR